MEENHEQLYQTHRDYMQFQFLYNAGMKVFQTRLEVLNHEFSGYHQRSPIHYIETRLKSENSIINKLKRKGYTIDLENAKLLNDVAGVRVVCGYIEDVYFVEEMIARQSDIEIVKRQDYIKTPNFNGYRSLHLDIRLPINLSNKTEYVPIEVQIRSVAMDFWASLEHDVRYKADKSSLPQGINEEMFACAEEIAKIDAKMQDMYDRIRQAKK